MFCFLLCSPPLSVCGLLQVVPILCSLCRISEPRCHFVTGTEAVIKESDTPMTLSMKMYDVINVVLVGPLPMPYSIHSEFPFFLLNVMNECSKKGT